MEVYGRIFQVGKDNIICYGKFKKGKDNLVNNLYRHPLGRKNSYTVKILALYTALGLWLFQRLPLLPLTKITQRKLFLKLFRQDKIMKKLLWRPVLRSCLVSHK